MKPTQTYTQLDKAYGFFNEKLFNNELPDCLITMQRKKGAYGYFFNKRFYNKADNQDVMDEIALNPSNFKGREDIAILSTLAHEMCHLWQAHNGKPSRNGYHNKQWAARMEAIGLLPQALNKEEGVKTGQSVSHSIIENGIFQIHAKEWLENEELTIYSDVSYDTKTAKKKKASKTKYTCPDCDTNAWGKPETLLICGDCYRASEDIVYMQAENEENEEEEA